MIARQRILCQGGAMTLNSNLLKISTLRIQATDTNHKSSVGEIEIHTWTKQQRLWRALKSLCIFWLFAAISVLIPLLHFILVPVLLLLGPIMAGLAYRRPSRIIRSNLNCPNCDLKIEVLSQSLDWPIQQKCAGCSKFIRLEVSSD